jgi:hypothetical protein
MRRSLVTCAGCAALLLAVGPVASAHPGNGHENGDHGSSAAAKLCTAEHKADPAAFKAVWGDPRHAMRNCMRANRDTSTAPAAGAEALHNAAQECRADRTADPAGFEAFWGTNDNHHNAFGKCVSARANGTYQEGTPVA